MKPSIGAIAINREIHTRPFSKRPICTDPYDTIAFSTASGPPPELFNPYKSTLAVGPGVALHTSFAPSVSPSANFSSILLRSASVLVVAIFNVIIRSIQNANPKIKHISTKLIKNQSPQ